MEDKDLEKPEAAEETAVQLKTAEHGRKNLKEKQRASHRKRWVKGSSL